MSATCDNCCTRPGDLVVQEAQPPIALSVSQPKQPWVFRYWACRWCRAAWNRTAAKRGSKPLRVVKELPDAEVLASLKGKVEP